jgi:hypothetical protein
MARVATDDASDDRIVAPVALDPVTLDDRHHDLVFHARRSCNQSLSLGMHEVFICVNIIHPKTQSPIVLFRRMWF